MGARRKYIVFFIKAAIAIFALTWIVFVSDIDSIRSALKEANYCFIGAGVLVFLLGQYFASYRWNYVLRNQGMAVARLETWRLTQIGTLLGNFLPGQGSGDLVKAAFLFKRFPNSKEKLIASVIYDRILGVFAILSIVSVSLICIVFGVGPFFQVGLPLVHIFGAGVAILLLVMLLLASERARFFVKRVVGGKVAGFARQLGALFSKRKLFFYTLAISLFFQATWILSVWLMFRSIEPSASLPAVVFSAPLSVLMASVPVTLGGIGVREGALSLLMQQSGMSMSVATTGALLTLIPLFASSMIGGVLLFYRKS